MIPLVLIISYGQEKCCDIIKGITKANGEISEDITIEFENSKIQAHKLNITTKYYATQIALFEWEDINSIPSDVLANTEGCIFYFDTDSETSGVEMCTLHEFVENNNIEVPCLLTKSLSENVATFELKKSCNSQFIIIDLNEVEEEQVESHNGYSEIIEVLRNNIWSNVNVSWFSCPKNSNDFELHDESLEEGDVEKQLAEFEGLLDSIQKFKLMSENLEREDVLNNAEKLAEHFAIILSED